jgi:hypothetical protein
MSIADDLSAIIASGIATLQKAGATISSFAQSQLALLRQQAILIGEGVAAGDFAGPKKKLLDHHLAMLKILVENFKSTVVGLSLAAVQQAWNAMVNAIWAKLDQLAGFPLPRPA